MSASDPTADGALTLSSIRQSPCFGCEGETDDEGRWTHDRACACRRQPRRANA